MGLFISLIAVLALVGIALVGVDKANLQPLFGIIIPYAAIAIFLIGFVLKVLGWAKIPVPFRIPTTGGQMKSDIEGVKHSKFDNPDTTVQVVVRMLLEVLLFRSLFRNTKAELREGPRLAYGTDIWLWLAGLAFHWSFLVIVLRHLRFFFAEVPMFVQRIEALDGFLQILAPLLYITDAVILGAITYLFIRRVIIPQVKYISLPADYFPLLLILGIVITGVLMRYVTRIHVVGIKELAMGLVSFKPAIPEEGIGSLFYAHLFLVSSLIAYFPFSKLMHMGGVFMSPTRNLANNNRRQHHENPWNYDVKVHTYDAYEEEFRDKMKEVGLPVEKE
jgi:nitrate reductase gamma subunit